jgi:hypothetical protein
MDRKELDLTEEDAFRYIVTFAREDAPARYSSYGYDLYLPNIMRAYLLEVHGVRDGETGWFPSVSPPFYAAAWDLCRRGILRPGINTWGTQSTEDGSAGNGYSITPFGRQWLEESDRDDYVPTEPGRFARMLDEIGALFGDGYRERAQEAIRCYGAHAYLACCAMCGAAAESILLAIAIAKSGDEKRILKEYASAGGRSRIENRALGRSHAGLRDEFRGYLGLLKYWRDAAAHGHAQGITDNEAFTSLAVLLRLSRCASDNWSDLTRNP